MCDEQERLREIFFHVQRGLPRQGPGSDESTLAALSLCAGLPKRPTILDMGCSPGMQALALAQALMNGHITAVDIHQEYLDELKERAKAAKAAAHIDIVAGDMNKLPFPPQSFDLIWSEGAPYIMGFEKALVSWKRFLKPGGYVAVSELVWLQPDPPAEVAEFFGREYPAMTGVENIVATLQASGYEPRGHFTLPNAAWWDSYYTPLGAKLPSLKARYAGDEEALNIIEMTECEIDMRRRFGGWYGYEFFIGRRID